VTATTTSSEKSSASLVVAVLIALVVIEILLQFGSLFGLGNSPTAMLSVGLALIIFLLHGWKTLGVRNLIAFLAIAFVISFTAEALGVATGLVFGPYHYTGLFGPKILGVPPLIQAAYAAMGYSSLMIGRLILRMRGAPTRIGSLLAASLLGALIMVAWDVSMDPFNSTVGGIWIWHQPGPYFGIGMHNYFGWFVTVFLYLVVYHLFALRWPEQPSLSAMASKLFLAVPIFLYAAFGLGDFLPAFIGGVSQPFASPGNYNGSVQQLTQSMALVSVFTMGIPIVAALMLLREDPQSNTGST
jgi:uncharacterized membrane protein